MHSVSPALPNSTSHLSSCSVKYEEVRSASPEPSQGHQHGTPASSRDGSQRPIEGSSNSSSQGRAQWPHGRESQSQQTM